MCVQCEVEGKDVNYALSDRLPRLFQMVQKQKMAKSSNYTFTAPGKTTIKMSFAANDAANISCSHCFQLFDYVAPTFRDFYEDQNQRRIEEDSARAEEAEREREQRLLGKSPNPNPNPNPNGRKRDSTAWRERPISASKRRRRGSRPCGRSKCDARSETSKNARRGSSARDARRKPKSKCDGTKK